MWKHDIGYRHENGVVEGFSGSSMISKEGARQNALNLLGRKLDDHGKKLDHSRLAEDNKTAARLFTKPEIEQIRKDWKV